MGDGDVEMTPARATAFNRLWSPFDDVGGQTYTGSKATVALATGYPTFSFLEKKGHVGHAGRAKSPRPVTSAAPQSQPAPKQSTDQKSLQIMLKLNEVRTRLNATSTDSKCITTLASNSPKYPVQEGFHSWDVLKTTTKKSRMIRLVADKRYKPIALLGFGEYGMVMRCRDLQDSKDVHVVLKHVHDLFLDLDDAKRILREIRILKHMNLVPHPNIIQLITIVPPLKASSFHSIGIIMENSTDSLYEAAKRTRFTDAHVRIIISQILSALLYLKLCGVVHRDLKPANIVIDEKTRVKLIDFGLARGVMEESKSARTATEYVQTRFYRAPEVLCGKCKYGFAADMWSVGCILGELILGKILFVGQGRGDQILKITAGIGCPSEETISRMNVSPKTKPHLSTHRRNRPNMAARLQEANASSMAIDLIQKMLRFDPMERITVEEALKHPYIMPEEVDFTKPEKFFDSSFENYSSAQWSSLTFIQELFWKEILEFRPKFQSVYDRWKVIVEESKTKSSKLSKTKRRPN